MDWEGLLVVCHDSRESIFDIIITFWNYIVFKGLFIWGKTPHLPDPELRGEIPPSHKILCIFISRLYDERNTTSVVTSHLTRGGISPGWGEIFPYKGPVIKYLLGWAGGNMDGPWNTFQQTGWATKNLLQLWVGHETNSLIYAAKLIIAWFFQQSFKTCLVTKFKNSIYPLLLFPFWFWQVCLLLGNFKTFVQDMNAKLWHNSPENITATQSLTRGRFVKQWEFGGSFGKYFSQ